MAVGVLGLVQFALSVVLGLTRLLVQCVLVGSRLSLLYLAVFVYILWSLYYSTTAFLLKLVEVFCYQEGETAQWRTASLYAMLIFLAYKITR